MSVKIKGLEGIAPNEVQRQLENGARFVIYRYTISIIIMTFRRSSNIYFIKAGHNAIIPGLKFTLLTMLLGWWGIPWGPIYTIGSIFRNLSGGVDVTQEVIESLATPEEETEEQIIEEVEKRLEEN